MDDAMEGRAERIAKPRSLQLKELLSLSDPDLLGGPSCVLLELLNETPGMKDRLGKRQELKSILERIEKWSIPQDRADAVFCSLWEKNLDMEVLKKAQALVPAQFREMELDIVHWKAEGDKWKVELLKGIVSKLIKEIYGLEQEAEKFMHEVGQKNMEIEAIRRNAQELEHEVGEKNMEIEVIQRKPVAETEWRVASMEAITRKAKEDELKIQSLQKQLAETEWRVASMEATVRKAKEDELRIESLRNQLAETESRVALMEATTRKVKEDELRIESLQTQLTETESRVASMEATTRKAKEDELRIEEATSRVLTLVDIIRKKVKDDRIELLPKQLAGKSEEVLEVKKVNTLADEFWETKLERACKLAENELDMTAEEDLRMEDLEDFRAAKRAKVELGSEGIRVESVGDEDEADGKQRSDNGGLDGKSNVDDSNQVRWGVGTNSGEEEVDGCSHSCDRHVVERNDGDELQGGHVTERSDGDGLQGEHVTERNYGRELQGAHVTDRNNGNDLQCGHVAERNDGDELPGGGAAKKMDFHSSNPLEVLQRTKDFAVALESEVLDCQNVNPKIEKLPGNTSQLATSTLSGDESHHGGEEFSKMVDKSPTNSPPRTLRVRMESPQVPCCSQVVFNEDDHMLQQQVSSPITPALSRNDITPSSEQDFELGKITVPDPDFHDFDASRMETDICPGQVWAIYDDQCGMPRYYARINTTQTKPFKAHINWLEHCPATGEEIAWTKNTGLSITCGDFMMGGSDVVDSINSFSHCVVDKISKGLLKIYPKKGQVWAVYRNPEQGKGPMGGPRFHVEGSTLKYEMVEILSEFCDKNGLRTGTLVQVTGFKTVFRRQDWIESFRSFKPEELVKFSHSVPNQRIEDSDTDAHGIPRGSLELDPASTPLDPIMNPSDPSRVQTSIFQVSARKDTTEGTKAHDGSEKTPKWVKLLNPIAKLPTNVGSRIRNRVRDAIEAGPPQWAVELLEESISREVYKGNAAGPTKRMIISILDKVQGEISRSGSTQRWALDRS